MLHHFERLPLSSLLLFAASDSTSVALSRAFEQLARCPDVQDRLRKEIVEATSDHEALSYNELNELKFLHAVAKETLRLYVKYCFPVPLMFTLFAARRYPPIVKFERMRVLLVSRVYMSDYL